MVRDRRSRIHRLLLLSLLTVALVLLMPTSAAAQQPGTSQPRPRYFPVPGQQNANAPPVRIPVTRPQKEATGRATNSPAPSFSTSVYDTNGSYAVAVAVGDLNRDGWPDMVVANQCAEGFMGCPFYGGSLAVFLGSGGGGFLYPAIYPSGGNYTYGVAILDVNHDGKLDVLAANSPCDVYNCFSIAEFLGNGDGTLQSPQLYAPGWPGFVGSWPGDDSAGWTATADLNGDGIPDLVTVPGDSSVYVQLGNADGTFQPAVAYSSGGEYAGAVAIADVNGDGHPDIIAMNQCADAITCGQAGATGSVGVLAGNGDGTFQPTLSFSTGGVGSSSMTLADVNLDGKPDVLVTNQCDNQGWCPHGDGTVGVLINGTPYTATTTKLISSLNPSSSGQAVTFTATVKPYSGILPDDAFVTFMNGATNLGTAPLVAGAASLTTSALPVGTLNVTAKYAFDGTYGASTGPLSQVVKAVHGYPTSLSLTASPSPGVPYQGVTLTAALTAANGPIPNGEVVTFYQHAATIGSGVIRGGVATFATSPLPDGAYTFRAVYPGDATFKSSSATVAEPVDGYPTAIYVGSSLNPSTYGQPVTFQVWVYPYNPTFSGPTGNVKFVWDRFTLGSATLSGNFIAQASFTTSILNADTYPLTAMYVGDAENASSTSDVLNQVVLQTTSAATLTSSANPSTAGQAITFTARITSPTVIAKGPVTFTVGKTALGTAQLSGSTAKLTTSSLPPGRIVVTVTYEGDSNISKSTASLAQVVQ